MGKGFRAIWYGIVDAYGELFPAVGMNVLWLLLSLPLAFVGGLVIVGGVGAMAIADDERTGLIQLFSVLLAILLAMGPNPAAAGLHLWANRLVKEERLEFSLFWEGLRQYWWPSLKLFAISFGGFFLLFVNALFYLRSEIGALQLFGVVWLWVMFFWTAMQIYQLPLLIEQDDKRIRLVLKNSFFLSIANFVPTLTLVVVLTILVVVSLVIPLLIVLLTGSLVALITARALNLLLERYRPSTVGDGSTA